MPLLIDQLGRHIDNLRISVTDRCNFRCLYCMPEEGMEWLPKENILSFEEIERIVRILAPLGIRKLRLTGGEPLLRKDLPTLISLLNSIEGIDDIALTTNALGLAGQAEALKESGLHRVNVSLDSLLKERFEQITRRDALGRVLEGIEKAAMTFAGPLKINAVLLRGLNDGEAPAFAQLARRHGHTVRFIEYMPLDADETWSRSSLVTGAEIRDLINRHLSAGVRLIEDPLRDAKAPAFDYVFSDGAPGKIGFINSVSEPFCEHCNRIRITAEGKLRTCLFSQDETDLAALIRGGASDDEIAAAVRAAVHDKEPGHRINEPDFIRANRSMSQIGG